MKGGEEEDESLRLKLTSLSPSSPVPTPDGMLPGSLCRHNKSAPLTIHPHAPPLCCEGASPCAAASCAFSWVCLRALKCPIGGWAG